MEEEKDTQPEPELPEVEQPDTTPVIDAANEAALRLEEATAKQEALLNRQEQMIAKRALGGMTEAGTTQEKPKVLTDTEYAEALERGEVNPLKEDGLIK